MDTIPEQFNLCNAPIGKPPGRGGIRVPFGLRDGRAWAPSEVAKGKACGCICPGCGVPLAAKAQTSRRRRAHFAHVAETNCQTGRETGIHLRAKQLIAERLELRTPAWLGDLVNMPNPPHARDDEGQLHWGREVDYPARLSVLRDVQSERWFGSYKPDVYALDEAGELLIEIRVTHAVDDRKAARVQARGHRMIEIDLSRLDRDTPHDLAAFEQAVLFEPANRTWISCPEAVADWQESKQELDAQVAARNVQIAEQRELLARAGQARPEGEARQAKDKAARKAYVRRLERQKHADNLAQLFELTSQPRIERILLEYQASAVAVISERLEAAPPAVRSACLRAHPEAWIFGVDPALWQLLAYEHFVGKRPSGDRFNQREVACWVRKTFPYEKVLYRLFATQYGKRADAQRAGFPKRGLGYWVFTAEENARIPNFYAPVNAFVDRLVAAQLVRRLPGEGIGECQVLPPPPTGWSPIAADLGMFSMAVRPDFSSFETPPPRIGRGGRLL